PHARASTAEGTRSVGPIGKWRKWVSTTDVARAISTHRYCSTERGQMRANMAGPRSGGPGTDLQDFVRARRQGLRAALVVVRDDGCPDSNVRDPSCAGAT